MLYFDTLPKILTPDQNGKNIILTNLLSRSKLVEELQNNPLLFYKYTLQDGDTPEIVAHKYYGDSYKYWIVLHSNQILDPLWQWPMAYDDLMNHLYKKYESEATNASKTPLEYINSTIHHYEKITTITNDDVNENVTRTALDFASYSSLVISSTAYYDSENTYVGTVNTSKRAVTIHDYEYELNESRRIINILNENYVTQMEEQFKLLMRTTNV